MSSGDGHDFNSATKHIYLNEITNQHVNLIRERSVDSN